jgi:cytochrome b involved in lipid metabolism
MDGHTYPIHPPYDVKAPEFIITNLSKSKDNKNLPKPYKIRRFYTDKDVRVHNTSNDCWVVLFNKVYDLTILI